MSNRDLSLVMRLYADTARFVSGLTQGEGSMKRFGSVAKREFDAIRSAATSIQGQLASLGLATGTVASLMQSARMDKGLTQIGQTAGMSRSEVAQLRGELFRMAGETGQAVDDLQVGFNNAVQSGLKFNEALPVLDATNKAMAVTGASADRLTAGLTVAATAFNFDLAKPELAQQLLEKMTVAGRLGNAELQNLSDIFARVGVNASSAGFSFDKTLAFIEGLSQIERQPERLATLADSTLRLFNNLKYMKELAQATGVRFFDSKTGERRDPIEIFKDVKAKYDKLKTDKQRAVFLQNALDKADLDTIKGVKALLGGDMLDKIGGDYTRAIGAAGGTFKNDLPEAISNAVDQVGRLKSELRKAADEFTRPINDTLQNAIKRGLDSKESGGLGLSGKEMVAGGAATALGTVLAARYGGMALAKRFGGTAAGVAEGKALEAAAGVTPVFVVNWPGAPLGGLPGMPGGPSTAPTAGTVASGAGLMRLAGRASLSVAPLAAMYGVKEWAEDQSNDVGRVNAIGGVSDSIKRVLGWLGMDKDASIAARREANRAELNGDNELKGEIRIAIDREGSVTGVRASSSGRVAMNVDNGVTMAGL